MASLPQIKRIVKEDFSEDDRALIDKLSFSLNPFMEQVVDALTKKINTDNLSREIKQISVVTVVASSIPVSLIQIKTDLPSKIIGINCIRCENLDSPAIITTSAPFLFFTQKNDIIVISNVLGLTASASNPLNSYKYRLTLEIIS